MNASEGIIQAIYALHGKDCWVERLNNTIEITFMAVNLTCRLCIESIRHGGGHRFTFRTEFFPDGELGRHNIKRLKKAMEMEFLPEQFVLADSGEVVHCTHVYIGDAAESATRVTETMATVSREIDRALCLTRGKLEGFESPRDFGGIEVELAPVEGNA